MLHYCTANVDAGRLDLSAAAAVGEGGSRWRGRGGDSAAQTLGLQTSFAWRRRLGSHQGLYRHKGHSGGGLQIPSPQSLPPPPSSPPPQSQTRKPLLFCSPGSRNVSYVRVGWGVDGWVCSDHICSPPGSTIHDYSSQQREREERERGGGDILAKSKLHLLAGGSGGQIMTLDSPTSSTASSPASYTSTPPSPHSVQSLSGDAERKRKEKKRRRGSD